VLLSFAAALAVVAAAWGSPPTPAARAVGRPAHRAAPPAHIVVVVEENHAFEQVIGSPAAPFLNRLTAQGTLLTHYYAATYPSLPNYVACSAAIPRFAATAGPVPSLAPPWSTSSRPATSLGPPT
jgi:hypothetical protein